MLNQTKPKTNSSDTYLYHESSALSIENLQQRRFVFFIPFLPQKPYKTRLSRFFAFFSFSFCFFIFFNFVYFYLFFYLYNAFSGRNTPFLIIKMQTYDMK